MSDQRYNYTCRAAKADEAAAFQPLWKELNCDIREGYSKTLFHALEPGNFRVVTRSLKISSNEEIKEELLGCLIACTHGRIGFIGYFSIFPQHRGQGIGTLLFRDSLDYLHRAGCTSIGLDAEPEAAELYSKHGFSRPGSNSYVYNRSFNGDEDDLRPPPNRSEKVSPHVGRNITEIKALQDQEAFSKFVQRDLRVTSFERSQMLKSLFSIPGWHIFSLSYADVDDDDNETKKISNGDSHVTGTSYVAVQPDPRGLCVGPMYVDSKTEAKLLLDYVTAWHIRTRPSAHQGHPVKLNAAVYSRKTRNVLTELGWTEGKHSWERMWLGPEPVAQSKLDEQIALVIDSGLG